MKMKKPEGKKPSRYQYKFEIFKNRRIMDKQELEKNELKNKGPST